MSMISDTTKPMKPAMIRMTPKVAGTERRNPWKIRSTRMAAGMTRMVPTLYGDMRLWSMEMGVQRREVWRHGSMEMS